MRGPLHLVGCFSLAGANNVLCSSAWWSFITHNSLLLLCCTFTVKFVSWEYNFGSYLTKVTFHHAGKRTFLIYDEQISSYARNYSRNNYIMWALHVWKTKNHQLVWVDIFNFSLATLQLGCIFIIMVLGLTTHSFTFSVLRWSLWL